jgi:general secretion pathway protein G
MIVRSTSFTARKALRANRSAFTLLEVLVVVAIIVMLAGVGSALLYSRYEESKVSRAKIDCKKLAQAVDIYKTNNDSPPSSIQQLTQAQPNGGDPLATPTEVVDPWGKPYQLDASGMQTKVFTTTPKGVTVSNLTNK